MPRLIGVRQDWAIDVDDDLVALSWSPGVDVMVKGRLRKQGQGVRLLLGHGRRFRGNASRLFIPIGSAPVERLARGSNHRLRDQEEPAQVAAGKGAEPIDGVVRLTPVCPAPARQPILPRE